MWRFVFASILLIAVLQSARAEDLKLSGASAFPGAAKRIWVDATGQSRMNFDATVRGLTVTYLVGGQGVVVAKEAGQQPTQMARFNSYWVACRKDIMTDEIMCRIEGGADDQLGESKLALLLMGDKICAPSNNFPGMQALIRVDDLPAIKAVEMNGACLSSTDAAMAREQFSTGNLLRLRYHRWPDKGGLESELPLPGLRVAMEIMDWLRAEAAAGRMTP